MHPPRVPATVWDSAGVEVMSLRVLPSLTDPDFLWQLERVSSFRTVDERGEPFVFNPTYLLPVADQVIVVDAAGEVPLVSLDRRSGEVRWRSGRYGEGPDEFSHGLRPVMFGTDLGLVDLSRTVLRKIGNDGSIMERRDLRLSDRLRLVDQEPGGRLLAERWTWKGVGDLSSTLYLFSFEGFGQELASIPPPGINAGDGQDGTGQWVPIGGGFIVTHTMRPSFFVADSTGRTVREIRLPLTPRELTEVEISRRRAGPNGFYASLLRVGPTTLSTELYALSDTIFGTWQSDLRRAAEDPPLDEGVVMLRLMSTSGSYLGGVYLPPDFTVYWTGARRIWGRRLDSTGTPVIEEYVLRPPN